MLQRFAPRLSNGVMWISCKEYNDDWNFFKDLSFPGEL